MTAPMNPMANAERFRKLQRLLLSHPVHPALDRPMSDWVLPVDSHLPQKLLPKTLREFLGYSWAELSSTKGVGDTRLEKVLDLATRAEREIVSPTPRVLDESSNDAPDAKGAHTFCCDPDSLTESTWDGWCRLVERHRLTTFPLGRFARSLIELPQGIWCEELRTYTACGLDELETLPGYGPARIRTVLQTLSEVVRAISGIPSDGHLRARLLTEHLHGVASWVDETLRRRTIPDLAQIADRFARPLLAQLELDLSPPVPEVVRRRWGVESPTETFEEIGSAFGVTRERIRQHAAKVAEVLAVRWPEGRHLLDDFYDLLQGASGTSEQLRLVRTILDACFSLNVAKGASRADVMAAWDRAGRNKETPMTAGELRAWLAAEFPAISPEVAHGWLSEDGLLYSSAGAGTLYFCHDPMDRLLHSLYANREPLHIVDVLTFVEGDERNVRNRLDRDPRFLEDEYKRIQASVHCSFFREFGIWNISLVPAAPSGSAPRTTQMPVRQLVDLVVGGLLQAGVADATVWGVHRYTDQILRKAYGAALPPSVNPFTLASMFTRHSDGLVRTMRRRRLRWDTVDGVPPVRGKRGWVGYVIERAGVPITLEELDLGLREFFQDYESYVLNQIESEDEEGGQALTYRSYPGNSTRIPKIFIPDRWHINLGAVNVSEGVRRFVAKVVASQGEYRFARNELQQLPWLIELCEHEAYGNMKWADERNRPVCDDPSVSEEAPAKLPEKAGSSEVQPGGEGGRLDQLLDQFL